MSKAHKGKVFTAEHCANIKKSRDKEFRKNLSKRMSGENNPMYGKETPNSVKKKLSKAMKGNKHLLGHKHSAETRARMSEAHKMNNHWNWKGGEKQNPYCPIFRRRDFRSMILDRDEYKCQNPDCIGKSTNLHIHHIDYNKQECQLKNLITLCASCNMRANVDRKWHEAYYNALMHKRSIYERI